MIKKILFGAAAAMSLTLTLTGCIDKNDTYEKLKPVQGGIVIYNSAMNQNTVAMQQANFGIRLAMLVAEAAKQPGVGNLDDLKVNDVKIKPRLFGSAKIDELANGDYKVTFTPNLAELDAYSREGVLLVKTNGTKQLSETSEDARWEISFENGLDMVYSGSGAHTITTSGGTTSIYYNAGYYTIEMDGIKCFYDSSKTIVSDWGGDFTLKPENLSLAYSDCAGKKFVLDGSAAGNSFVSFNNTTSTAMAFRLMDGEYVSSSALRSGTIEAEIFGNFDMTVYPYDDVTVVWNGNGTCRVTYGPNSVVL